MDQATRLEAIRRLEFVVHWMGIGQAIQEGWILLEAAGLAGNLYTSECIHVNRICYPFSNGQAMWVDGSPICWCLSDCHGLSEGYKRDGRSSLHFTQKISCLQA